MGSYINKAKIIEMEKEIKDLIYDYDDFYLNKEKLSEILVVLEKIVVMNKIEFYSNRCVFCNFAREKRNRKYGGTACEYCVLSIHNQSCHYIIKRLSNLYTDNINTTKISVKRVRIYIKFAIKVIHDKLKE